VYKHLKKISSLNSCQNLLYRNIYEYSNSNSNYAPSRNFDEFGERFFPSVHLDDLNARDYLVHQSHPFVCPYCDFLPQFSDKFTQISCNNPVSHICTVYFRAYCCIDILTYSLVITIIKIYMRLVFLLKHQNSMKLIMKKMTCLNE
jgi:hypothetical protein